ncbi:MAG: hypothetical protein CL512_04170 [Actinobacteria bacterium]|nr:hypothetical protein [Actinomycetota bacterium]
MLNVAVVGTGVMGTNHLRVLHQFEGVCVAAIVEPDSVRRSEVAQDYEVNMFGSIEDLLADKTLSDSLTAAVIATPTSSHIHIAKEIVDAGIATLIEKPIAASIEEALEIDSFAKERNVPVMVGHVERFNPAVIELFDPIYSDPIHVEVRRIGPFASRITDSVIHDLMVHDLDIVRKFLDSEITSVQATGKTVLSSSCDIATALLTFESGATASLTASRLGQKKLREIDITLEDSFVCADLLHRNVVVHRAEQGSITSQGSGYKQAVEEEVRYLQNRVEPLVAEWEAFFSAIENGETPPVTVQDGIEAVRMADQIAEVVASFK